MKNLYKNGKKSVFFEISYVNSVWCQKSVRLATLCRSTAKHQAGNTLECDHTPSRLGVLVWTVDGTPRWGKQAQLAARLDPQTISLSKWVTTKPQLICAPCGTRVHARLYIFALTSRAEPNWATARLSLSSHSDVLAASCASTFPVT